MAINCREAIAKGECQANCCGPVPIPNEDWKRLRFKKKRAIYMLMEDVFPGVVIPLGFDAHCVFLTHDFRCAIYDQRPEVCRQFGDRKETHPLLQCPFSKKERDR